MPDPRRPIKLRVGYKSPESLLTAFAGSLGQPEVNLPSKRDLPPGTRFQFELLAQQVRLPVIVMGEVTGSRRAPDGSFLLSIRYQAPTDRQGLDSALRELFDEHRNDKKREHARVPMHLTAEEHRAGAPDYRVTDLSRGGMGLDVLEAPLPAHVQKGTPTFVQVTTSDGTVGLHGEVAWVRPAGPAEAPPSPAQFGIRFGRLRGPSSLALDRLLVLYGLPTGPWRAQVNFGMEAVEKMP